MLNIVRQNRYFKGPEGENMFYLFFDLFSIQYYSMHSMRKVEAVANASYQTYQNGAPSSIESPDV